MGVYWHVRCQNKSKSSVTLLFITSILNFPVCGPQWPVQHMKNLEDCCLNLTEMHLWAQNWKKNSKKEIIGLCKEKLTSDTSGSGNSNNVIKNFPSIFKFFSPWCWHGPWSGLLQVVIPYINPRDAYSQAHDQQKKHIFSSKSCDRSH